MVLKLSPQTHHHMHNSSLVLKNRILNVSMSTCTKTIIDVSRNNKQRKKSNKSNVNVSCVHYNVIYNAMLQAMLIKQNKYKIRYYFDRNKLLGEPMVECGNYIVADKIDEMY